MITTAASTTNTSAGGARRTDRSYYVWHALTSGGAAPRRRQWQSGIAAEEGQIVFVDQVLGADPGCPEPARSDPAPNSFGITSCASGSFGDRQHCCYILQQLESPSQSAGARPNSGGIQADRRRPELARAPGRIDCDRLAVRDRGRAGCVSFRIDDGALRRDGSRGRPQRTSERSRELVPRPRFGRTLCVRDGQSRLDRRPRPDTRASRPRG